MMGRYTYVHTYIHTYIHRIIDSETTIEKENREKRQGVVSDEQKGRERKVKMTTRE